MEVKRVIDHDMPAPEIVIYDFIDFPVVKAGLVFFIHADYSGDIEKDVFDPSNVKITEIERYTLYMENLYQYFEESFSKWWMEPHDARRVPLDEPDEITKTAIKQFSQELIRDVFEWKD